MQDEKIFNNFNISNRKKFKYLLEILKLLKKIYLFLIYLFLSNIYLYADLFLLVGCSSKLEKVLLVVLLV